MRQEWEEVNSLIKEEKKLYVRKNAMLEAFTHKKRYTIWKYLSIFRKMQYYRQVLQKSSGVRRFCLRIKYYCLLRKMNILGEKCGIEIASNCSLGKCINIYHGGVTIGGETIIGDYCTIRGNTVIGNKGLQRFNGEPVIGNHVEIGIGANIIGNVTIADGCEIGANSVVTKSFTEPNTIIVGVPGRKIERK